MYGVRCARGKGKFYCLMVCAFVVVFVCTVHVAVEYVLILVWLCECALFL